MKLNTSVLLGCLALICLAASPAGAQSLCPPDFCDDPIDSICDPGGFEVTFVGYTAAASEDSGMALFTYQICSPPEGTCSLDPGRSCLDHAKCAKSGAGECIRDCAVDTFRGLSHFDAFFPELGGDCLSENTEVSGTCACTAGSSASCSVDGAIVLGDGSCYDDDTPVAKCDNTNLAPGDCITMTIEIAGEVVGLGAGATVVASKASTTCSESCILGPSCDPCDGITNGDSCLTRTIGFWGTHPHITDDFVSEDAQITVCGEDVWDTDALNCESVTEALCSAPGREFPKNPPYVTLVRQLAAAKINLAATAALEPGAGCGSFLHGGMTVQNLIAHCEANYCGALKQAISESGCIEALAAFNESEDIGFEVTPAPFDRPGPAQPGECKAAKGTGKNGTRLVIGQNAPSGIRCLGE